MGTPGFSPLVISRSFIVVGFTLKSVICPELMFVWGIRFRSRFTFSPVIVLPPVWPPATPPPRPSSWLHRAGGAVGGGGPGSPILTLPSWRAHYGPFVASTGTKEEPPLCSVLGPADAQWGPVGRRAPREGQELT